MNKYRVVIKETLIKEIEVEAVDRESAIAQIESDYLNGEIILDYDNHFNSEFDCFEADE